MKEISKRKRKVLSVVLFLLTSVCFLASHASAAMPVPSGGQTFFYTAEELPVVNDDPSLVKPFGFGPITTGGNELTIGVELPAVNGAVDMYVVFYLSADPGNVYNLRPDGQFQAFSLEAVGQSVASGSFPSGFVPWKPSTSGPVNQLFLSNLPVADVPAGISYSFFVVVTPVGSIQSFYLWQTDFLVPDLIPDTGQTDCYNSSGATISCTNTGQNGAHTIYPISFNDNGDGTLTDNVTELVWQEQDDNALRTWDSAISYCSGLNLGGKTGWRLPSKKELMNIVDYGNFGAIWFSLKSGNYWSSTTYANDANDAWYLISNSGDVLRAFSKSRQYFALCVHGERRSVPVFINNSGDTVTDIGSGLMWQRNGDGIVKSWDSALAYCQNLSLGGFSDWRLPNIKELASITNDAGFNPAIDRTYFPNALADFYWSSTTDASAPADAWYVTFFSGSVNSSAKGENFHARCVR